ncbi:hypothetical protein SAMN05421760_101156 [Neptunomonas antarctica]|uniref:Uncharacterized protein n=1 Tax=Neptunomonas antarctica TaxID=619304 RepID=A0A1N7IUT7_9GAMM|nr:hypothetical protein SAMN05421760_101156 [Neptunomonas antarctica]
MKDFCQREGVKPDQVILHSDNDSPMKGATMLAAPFSFRIRFFTIVMVIGLLPVEFRDNKFAFGYTGFF